MRFLSKQATSPIEEQGLRYEVVQERGAIKALLLVAQYGYCAYTERRILPLDSCEIEHFDPGRKGTDEDGYRNWYAVIRWINAHKAKKLDERFLPILYLPDLRPEDDDIATRISYDPDFGVYTCADDDVEAANLLAYLGVNREEVVEARQRHVSLVRGVCDMCGDDEEMLFAVLQEHLEYLHFPTALKAELDLEISPLYQRG